MDLTPDQTAALQAYFHQNPSPRLNLIFLGISGVGKLSLLLRLHWPSFRPEPHYDPTLDVPLEDITIPILDTPVKLQVTRCDIATDFSHTTAFKQWVDGFDACALVYCPTSRASLRLLRTFCEEVKVRCVLVLASKADVPQEMCEVSGDEGREFARDLGARFGVVSAMTGQGWGREDVAGMVVSVLLRRIRDADGEKGEAEDSGNADAVEAHPRRRSILQRVVERIKGSKRTAPEEGHGER